MKAVPDDCGTLVEKTWLGQPKHRARVDRLVKKWLADHRGLTGAQRQDVGPLTIETAWFETVQLGKSQRWLWCTAAVALTAELLFCAEKGGTYDKETVKSWDEDQQGPINLLRILRNAVCHPAHHTMQSGEPHVLQLQAAVNNLNRADLADALNRSWAALRDRHMAEFALSMLHQAGLAFMERYRSKLG